jgi:hypothetical protein
MGQQPFKPITNQQSSSPLSIPITNRQPSIITSTIPQDLFTVIASFMNHSSQLALACTCTKIYNYYMEKCKIVAFLCSSPKMGKYSKSKHCKVLQRWLSETGWATAKVILKEFSIYSQKNNSYPISALFSDESLQFSNELKYESINALILESSSWLSPTSTLLNISFLENFSNLKIIKLSKIFIKKNMVSILSKLSLLIISLNRCEITNNCLSKIFETCTTLEEIELSINSNAISIMLPPQVKKFQIGGFDLSVQMNLSHCTQLQSL